MRIKAITDSANRRTLIGGSDARIIMGDDEGALVRLWQEKRGEIEPEDFSGNLIVQLGVVTEDLNRRWYEANTGRVITESGAALDGRYPRWTGARKRYRFRGQVHVAVVVLGRSGGRKVCGTAAA